MLPPILIWKVLRERSRILKKIGIQQKQVVRKQVIKHQILTGTKEKTQTTQNTAKKSTGSFENKTPVLGSAKKMDISEDLYKELEIDRAWDEKTIRTYLKGIQKIWTQRQGATNDKEQCF